MSRFIASRQHALRASLQAAASGERVLFVSPTRAGAVAARDLAMLPGRKRFKYRVGKGSIRFGWAEGKLQGHAIRELEIDGVVQVLARNG